VFSETRYALNGDLRVAYRASREGTRDIVSVPNWFICCEVFPELPSIQGWVDAMTSLGRLIYFDQPGTGASDPVTPGALPTLEQWADSITAVLDALGSREAVLVASNSAFAPAALFAATHPSRTSALVVLDGYADAGGTPLVQGELQAARVRMWGTGEAIHAMNPDMPWNEEIRAAWARMERLAGSPRSVALMMPLATEVDVRAVLPTVRVPTLVVQHSDDVIVPPAKGKYIAEDIPDAKYVELSGRNWQHFVEPWRESFQEIAQFITGHQTCAMSIRDAVQALGIQVRAGLHTGECQVRGDDIGGIGGHIGARVSALAGPNDVLVSSTLRDLVIGSGLEFDDRGHYELKGVPGQWRLFAVASV
jgi:pimeloyl-ACP methyl ester carboxylesterase